MAGRIDPKTLPKRALIDTNILTRFLGKPDEDDGASRAFCDAMIKHNRDLLIAAPTLAEYQRHPRPAPIPRVKSISVVAFDRLAAEHVPTFDRIKELAPMDGSLPCLKFDSLIVACAIRYKAEVLMTADARMRRLCDRIGLRWSEPSAYFDRQATLDFG